MTNGSSHAGNKSASVIIDFSQNAPLGSELGLNLLRIERMGLWQEEKFSVATEGYLTKDGTDSPRSLAGDWIHIIPFLPPKSS